MSTTVSKNNSIDSTTAISILSDADRLYDAIEVDKAIEVLAQDINTTLAGKPLLVVCILNGALVFYGKLLPLLSMPVEVDYVHATRYGNALSGDVLSWLAGPHREIAGREILLIDDILDEGATLAAIRDEYLARGAISVHSAVLVTKLRTRSLDIVADFSALTVPDRYVFGYGMDYKGYLRNAPGIYAENDKGEA